MDFQHRNDIIETCTRMMWSVDTREWAALPGLLGDTVVHDFTSIYGGESQVLTAAEVTGMWSKLIGAFDATQHLLGNHLVTVEADVRNSPLPSSPLTGWPTPTVRRSGRFTAPTASGWPGPPPDGRSTRSS